MLTPEIKPKRDGRKERGDRTHTLVSYVRERILDDIVQGRLASGEVFQLRTLADRYEVSKTPVREALSQLHRQGLVDSLPYKGYLVRPMDLSEFNEIFFLRELMEGVAAELAAKSMTDDDLDTLADMRPPTDTVGMSLAYDEYAHHFHALIARSTGSERLYDMFEMLYTDVRRLQYSGLGHPSAQHSSWEHQEIVTALRRRDPAAARSAMIRHVRNIKARALGLPTDSGAPRDATPVNGALVGREPAHRHQVFDNALPPILTIRPGAVVTFECPMCALPEGSPANEIRSLDPLHPHMLVGPILIEGAVPGDTLVVQILELDPLQDYGQTMIIPDFGLLADEFPEPYIHTFRFTERGAARMKPGIEIPLRPFCGIMGVAPGESGVHYTTPPRCTGGNLDIAQLTVGATLYLPVEVEGALFSCGDGHAAQGAGEVCGTAVETALHVTLKFDLRRGEHLAEPQFRVAPQVSQSDRAETFVTTASGPDLYDCSRRAVRYMIDFLQRDRGLTREEAYVLSSVATDLRIEEVVDQPNWLVSANLPLSVFVDDGGQGKEG
jgi:acetamidase/formamidase/DNA-binding GntR family transcriptional regulator